jgi:dolichyl-phosphate-mannose-protein mannosyltransferase
MPTHQEFTTWPDVAQADEAYNGTLWEVAIDDAHAGQQWKTKASHFQLVHHVTRAAMWTRNLPALPGWGFGQQEVNGHKMYHDKTLFWVASDIVRDSKFFSHSWLGQLSIFLYAGPSLDSPWTRLIIKSRCGFHTDTTNHASRPPPPKPKSVHTRSFFKKYFELQVAMFQHNSDLTDSHPYASPPINWPFLLTGVSFWTSSPDLRRQVYMIGNPAGWWFCVMSLSVIAGVFGADQFARRRGYSPIETRAQYLTLL